MKVRWVSKHAILAIHAEVVAEHGGDSSIRDTGLLDSAIAKPKNLLAYGKPTLFELASAYAVGLIQNHPFVDGNKRVGLVVSATFLYLNRWELNATEIDTAAIFLEVAKGKISAKVLSEWFKANTKKLK